MLSLGPGTLGPASPGALGAREARAPGWRSLTAIRQIPTKRWLDYEFLASVIFCYHESIGLDTVRDDCLILAGEGTF